MIDINKAEKQFFYRTISENLSVRALESLANDYHNSESKNTNKKPTSPESPTGMIKTLQDKLSATMGTKVQIIRKPTGEGQIIIKFNSDKELNELLDRFDVL